jgi:hypothetical protein
MSRLFCGLLVLELGLVAAAGEPPPGAEPDKKPAPKRPDLELKQPEEMKKAAPQLGKITTWIGKQPAKENKELAGKVVLVHFWSCDSESSTANFVHFAEWRQKYKDDGLRIVAVHTCDGNQPFPVHGHDEDPALAKDEKDGLKKLTEKIQKVAKTNPVVVETGVDVDGEVKHAWNVRRTPTFFLIDKKGKVRYCYEGFLEYQKLHKEKYMREKIEELLKEEVK